MDYSHHERLLIFSFFKRKHLCLFGMLHPILFSNLNLQVMGSLLPHFALLLVWYFIHCRLMVVDLRRSSFTLLLMLS